MFNQGGCSRSVVVVVVFWFRCRIHQCLQACNARVQQDSNNISIKELQTEEKVDTIYTKKRVNNEAYLT